ncbi:MAG TPA: DegT/DnrJ/EryC1/StrS family aminotransferase [candidate division Zixibacteria bacterium]|jgi:dTDP-4-amino-4,6-dideoxygalactose transaminase
MDTLKTRANASAAPATSPRVPFLDLKAQYASIKHEVDAAISSVINDSAFILGRAVAEFETDFAQYCGVQHCVAVNSGTSAIHLALLAAGVGPGDEVIAPANTFIATCAPIVYCGATPVLVDVDPATYNIDPELVKTALTRRTKVIMPVHLYGRPAPIEELRAIAQEAGAVMIEDACQAHGAMYKNRRVGQFGDAACFSFYPGKNLGAYGEGGAIVTNNAGWADKLRLWRDHGSSRKYHHDLLGYNYRLEGIQGAVLGVKLRHLDDWNSTRRERASRYRRLLQGANLDLPPEDNDAQSVYHLFVVQVDERDRFQHDLKAAGIDTLIHYPIPVHKQPAFAAMNQLNFPVTERLAARIVSLPIYPELTNAQQDHVAAVARASAAQTMNEINR